MNLKPILETLFDACSHACRGSAAEHLPRTLRKAELANSWKHCVELRLPLERPCSSAQWVLGRPSDYAQDTGCIVCWLARHAQQISGPCKLGLSDQLAAMAASNALQLVHLGQLVENVAESAYGGLQSLCQTLPAMPDEDRYCLTLIWLASQLH